MCGGVSSRNNWISVSELPSGAWIVLLGLCGGVCVEEHVWRSEQ
jgi:hypothetical protein